MFIKILLFLLLSLELFCNSLEEIYYIKSDDINISSIVPHAENDVKLFSFEEGKYSKKVPSKELLKLLKEHGYETYTESAKYVTFTKESPIDTQKMEIALKELYEKSYPEIKIKKISILPRGYVKSLDNDFVVNLKARNNLSKEGIFNVKTKDNKKIFFDYILDAEVSVHYTKGDMKKGDELSMLNTLKKTIPLEKFRAMPLQPDELGDFQIKHQMRENQIITIRDVESVVLVKKGASISVKIDDEDVALSMIAESLKDGKLNDTITVKKSDGKKFRVIVIGRNRVEMK